MYLNKSERRLLHNPFRRLLVKLFRCVDNSVISYCQYYMQCLPISYLIRARTNKFYKKCMDTTSVLLKLICNNHAIKNAAQEHYSKVAFWNDFVLDNKLTF